MATSTAGRHPFDTRGLAPMLHVVDVDRSVRFYAQLGFVPDAPLRDSMGRSYYCSMRAQDSHIMFARASGPVDASVQAVLLYLYSTDVVALRRHLLACGLRDGGPNCGGWPNVPAEGIVSEPSYPEYMRKGEIRIADPDGYCVLVGELG